MLALALAFPPPSPLETLRAALMYSLHAAHRPELVDLVAAADLDLDFPGLWPQPHAAGLRAARLAERVLAAAIEAGLPLEWIRVLLEIEETRQGREA